MNTIMPLDSIFVGCYERFVFKYDIHLEPLVRLERTAAHAAHTGAVKCLASMGRSVFSGGMGDVIRIYDAPGGMEVDSLTVPDSGGVSCLALFPAEGTDEAEWMMHGCTDGSVHLWRKADGSWMHQKRAVFHKETVNAVDIHATGRAAFTVSQDRSLVLWELPRGKRAFSCKLTTEATGLRFHPYMLDHYLLSYRNTVARINLEDSNVFHSWRQMADVQAFCFWKRHRFLTAADDGAVRVWDERKKDAALEITDAHGSRIKALDVISPNTCITAASDGDIKLWDLRKIKKRIQNEMLVCEETEARITCLKAVKGVTTSVGTKKKRKHD